MFLDIETYARLHDSRFEANPFNENAKVLVIAYNYYPGFHAPRRAALKPPLLLKEWEASERSILQRFYNTLRELLSREVYADRKTGEKRCSLRLVGFNLLKFDLPYLFGRMSLHGIDTPARLHDALFSEPFAIDLFQLSPLVSQKTREYGELWAISQKDVNRFFNLRVKEGEGEDVAAWYDAKDFARIERYVTEDFTFEQLYDAFLMYILEKEK
ncbi:MAG: hypothetical protein QXH27_04155 [Candidatus Micrarchaeia archaeon]